jgi:hypothetical protein
MSRLSRAGAAALTAAIVLAGCGGGGGGSATPASQSQSAPNSAAKVAPPPATGRQSFGTAQLTLALPKALRGATAKAVRAIPHGTTTATSTARHAQFVDPSPAPGFGVCNGNVIDIYVDGSLIPAIDGQGEGPDSLCVSFTADGTQTVSIPLFSNTNNNEVVVVEWDAFVENILALGEADTGSSFSPGSAINLTVTMQENAESLGVTDLNFNDPVLMQGESWTELPFSCPGTTSPFAPFTADANGVFIPVAGYGGTSTPTLTGTSDGGGTSKLVQTGASGLYVISADSSCDGVTVFGSAPNPAYSIYNDVTSANYSTYYNDYYFNHIVGSPNQGIWTLVNVYTDTLGQNFYQLQNQAVNGTIDIRNGG